MGLLSHPFPQQGVRSGIREGASGTQCFPVLQTQPQQQEEGAEVKCRVMPTCQLLPLWAASLQGLEQKHGHHWQVDRCIDAVARGPS